MKAGTAEDNRHGSEEDQALDREFAEVIPLIREPAQTPVVPARLDAAVMQLARTRVDEQLTNHWLLGQIPRVILVTLILFAVAMMFLAF